MPAMTKAKLIKENERLRKRVTSLGRAANRRAEEPKDSQRLRAVLTEALEQLVDAGRLSCLFFTAGPRSENNRLPWRLVKGPGFWLSIFRT